MGVLAWFSTTIKCVQTLVITAPTREWEKLLSDLMKLVCIHLCIQWAQALPYSSSGLIPGTTWFP